MIKKYTFFAITLSFAGLIAWWLIPSLFTHIYSNPSIPQINLADQVKHTVSMPKTTVLPAREEANNTSTEALITSNDSNSNIARVLANTSLPFIFAKSTPEAYTVALETLNDYSAVRPDANQFDPKSLILDAPLALYELSYDQLAIGKGVESASVQKGWRYLGRTTVGDVVTATYVYFGPNQNLVGSAGIIPLGAQIAQALNDLAVLLPVPKLHYEARLLSDTNRHFIWLKSSGDGQDYFYEVNPDQEWWIGSVRLYTTNDFISTYLNKIVSIRAQMQQALIK